MRTSIDPARATRYVVEGSPTAYSASFGAAIPAILAVTEAWRRLTDV